MRRQEDHDNSSHPVNFAVCQALSQAPTCTLSFKVHDHQLNRLGVEGLRDWESPLRTNSRQVEGLAFSPEHLNPALTSSGPIMVLAGRRCSMRAHPLPLSFTWVFPSVLALNLGTGDWQLCCVLLSHPHC